MECPPPSKRPRLSLNNNPLEVEEDPLEDELLSLPSEVNARRDPNARLERSRQRAVNKLKTAFESIFEKYGRDFEGVGDEVDLRTGRIVVNNGHIEGMRGSDLLVGESEDEGDGEGENGGGNGGKEYNEEERLLQGVGDAQGLSRLGQDVMLPQMMGMNMGGGVMLPQMMGQSELAMGGGFEGWPGMMGQMGLSNMGFEGQMGPGVMFSGQMGGGMMFPGQMEGFSGWPVEYGLPIDLQTSDPTWQAPALPPSFMYRPAALTDAPQVKKKRISLAAPRDEQGDNEDDVLLGAFTKNKGMETTETPIKQKLLLPKPPPDTGPEKKKRGPGKRKSKVGSDTPKKSAHKDAEKDVAKAPSPPRDGVAMAEAESTPSKTDGVQPDVEIVTADISSPTTEPEPTATLVETESPKTPEQKPTVMAVRSRPPPVQDSVPAEDPDVYIYVSDSEHKSARKPRNQSLRVEIVAKTPLDISSFRAVTPEQSEGDHPIPQEKDGEENVPPVTMIPLAPEEKETNHSTRPPAVESEIEANGQPEPPGELFTRHVVDAEYDLSDEDQPMQKTQRQPQNQAGASRKKDEDLLRKTLRKPLGIVASDTNTSDKPHDVPMPDAGNRNPKDSSLENQANREDERVAVELKESSPQLAPPIIDTESSIPSIMVRPPQRTEVIYAIGSEETPWPNRRRGRPSFRGRDPRGEIPDSDPIGGFSTQEDLDDDVRPPSSSLSFNGDEETTLEIPDSYIEPSSEMGIVEEETPRNHTVPSPTLSSCAPDDEMLGPIASLSLQPQDTEMLDFASIASSPGPAEISDPVPALSSQSQDGAATDTTSSPLPGTPHDNINNMTLESIAITSSPFISKPAQRKGDFHLRPSTPSYLTTPPRRPRGRPPKAKPTPPTIPATTPLSTISNTPTAAEPAKTPAPKPPPTTVKPTTTPTVTKPTKTPTSKRPAPSTKPTKTPTSKRPAPSTKPTKDPTSKPPPVSSSITPTAKRKRRSGVLSLLSDSEDDELAVLSPSVSSVTPIMRSSPASNHVRLFSRVSGTPRGTYLVKKPEGSARKGDKKESFMARVAVKRQVKRVKGGGEDKGKGGRCEGGCGK
ncbi:hypothetical protein QC764_0013170 [Podospora pseudoanserina]|uniref:Uncharacterized protein n=1 Tax=Podospora pseudoanserina TaxID=2609844 RepID=A0ABR0IN60_9PEZI|nr:hypothetical protein QC764_0013170 [Podospora pseudoanserina]